MFVQEVVNGRLKTFRLEKKMSRQELSKKSGLTVKTIERIEHDNEYWISLSSLSYLAEAMNVKLEDIFKGM